MDAGQAPDEQQQARGFSIALIVSGICLGLVAIALRVAGGLELEDATPREAFEAGSLSASRAVIWLLAGAGLAWIGWRGFTGRHGSSTARDVLRLALALGIIAFVQGLWLTGAAAALTAVVCALARHRASDTRSRPFQPV